MNIVVVLGLVVALAAAARSTWSPCGLSMLSQITPLAEAGRGHKFARTASWFVLGALLGGITLGCAVAGAALAVGVVGIGERTAIALVGGCALAAAAVDARVFGFAPPFLRRQVNEEWLSKFRPWVYGGGFGWQIGVGVTTYVMTAAVPLVVVMGALSANPGAALALGAVFGLARGLAVLLGASQRSPDALYAFHRRFDGWAEPVRQAVIGVELAVSVIAAWIAAPVAAAALITAGSAMVAACTRFRAPKPGIASAPGRSRPGRTLTKPA